MITEEELFENYYLDEEEIISYNITDNTLLINIKSKNNKEKYLKYLEEILKN